jgi:hypothetical protein
LEKKCSKCGEIKNVSEFRKMKKSPLGVRPDCKVCKSKQDKIYRDKNADILKEKSQIKQQSITESVKKRKDKHLEKLKEKYIGLHLGNNVQITKYIGYVKEFETSKYYRHYFEKVCNNCDKSSNLTPGDIERYIKNGIGCNYCKGTIRKTEVGVERKCSQCQEWLLINDDNFGISKGRTFGYHHYCMDCKNGITQKNREKPEVRKREYNQKKQKLKTDPLFKLTCNIRTLVRISFKNGFTKKSRTEKILGCSYEELKKHFEDRFESWMTWENYGKYNGDLNFGWDIDHIKPVSLAKNEEELIKLNHYTNLQPLCSRVNRYIKRDIENFVS